MLCTSWIVEYLTWQPATAGPYMCQAPKRTEMNVLTVVLSCTHLYLLTQFKCAVTQMYPLEDMHKISLQFSNSILEVEGKDLNDIDN